MSLPTFVVPELTTNSRLERLTDFCQSGNIILYGAGLTGKNVLQQLKKNNVYPLFIVDDTVAKQGMQMDGVHIKPLSTVKSQEKSYALIVTMLNPAMDFNSLKDNLFDQGIENVFSFIELSYLFPKDLLPYFHFDVRNKILADTVLVEKAFNLFQDADSRKIFLNNLDVRLNLSFDKILLGDKDHYFPASIIAIPDNSVFIDCGAYDGDTIHSFIRRQPQFDRIFAFEPDPANFNKLLHYCSNVGCEMAEKMFVFNQGLSDAHRFLRFNSLNNMASSIDEAGNSVIQIIDIDNFLLPLLKDCDGKIFLKMDIEGEEPKALQGCRQLILEKSPHMAVSIYHNPDDLWAIPLYIESIRPEYTFLLRQHGNDSMDLVLYAIAGSTN